MLTDFPWEQALGTTRDGLYLCSRNKTLIWSNRPDATLGTSISSQRPIAWASPLISEVLADGTARLVQSEGDTESGPACEAEVTPIVVDGSVAFALLRVRGDNERAVEIGTSERALRHLMRHSLDIVSIHSDDFRFLAVSPNIEQVLGDPAEEVIGASSIGKIHPDDLPNISRMALEALSDPTRTVYGEFRRRHRDGHWVRLKLRSRSIGNNQFIVHTREFTPEDSERPEQSLHRADRLASIGTLAASVAHEINNPAAFITTNLFVLQESLQGLLEGADRSPEACRTALQEADELIETNLAGMERIRAIVSDLQAFARDDASPAALVEVSDVAKVATTLVQYRVRPIAELSSEHIDAPAIWGQRAKLIQVVVNLLTNAADAVEASAAPRKISLRTGPTAAGGAFIEVEDSGAGIPPEDASKVFLPFFTTKEVDDGTGLGLWICREIVKAHDGKLTFESTVGRGTTFRLELPQAPAEDG